MGATKDDVLRLLRAGRERIAREGGWTQGVPARDAMGESEAPAAKAATCWCVLGALWAECQGNIGILAPYSAALASAETELFFATNGTPVAPWNDAQGRTQADAVALYDRAVAAVEARS